jgi:hypothetical protein
MMAATAAALPAEAIAQEVPALVDSQNEAAAKNGVI